MNTTEADVLAEAIGLHQAGRPEQAIAAYRRFLAQHPDRFDAHVNLAIALEQTGQAGAAANAYRAALALKPDFAGAHFNLGNILMQAGDLDGATRHFAQACAGDPGHADATFNLGNLLLHAGRVDDAIARYRGAIAARPDFARAHYNLGLALCRKDALAEGFAEWRQAAALRDRDANPPPIRQAHDQEQQQWRSTAGLVADGHGARVSGATLNAAGLTTADAQWTDAKPRVAVLDDALTPQALAALRHFCWAADVWSTVHRDGYLIATPEDGFACPLLAQLVEELRRGLPGILGAHPLHYLAGFKYGSRGQGTHIHADNAAVNVNLWITPDEANRDPQHGGVIVWDTPSPERDSTRYNADAPTIRAWLESRNAKPHVVPHRANRMLIFDSGLFHETDRFDFAQGYTDHRINITFLFGRRLA